MKEQLQVNNSTATLNQEIENSDTQLWHISFTNTAHAFESVKCEAVPILSNRMLKNDTSVCGI